MALRVPSICRQPGLVTHPGGQWRPTVVLRIVPLVAVAFLVVACSAGGQDQGLSRFGGARTDSCANITGLKALYWDYLIGTVRVDYPETIRSIPFNIGGHVINPVQPLYGLVYPQGWAANPIVEPSIQGMGLHVFRADGHALWHRRNETVFGQVSSAAAADFTVDAFHRDMAPGTARNVICSADSVPGQLALDLSSRVVTFGDYTAHVSTHTRDLGGATIVFVQVALAPTAQYDDFLYFVAFPLTAQMSLGGGSTPPECNDGIDNDGDGLVDYPDDPDCSSPLDDSESP